MREIKFRAWNATENRFEFFTLASHAVLTTVSIPSRGSWDVLSDWEQYTGKKDKNGKGIYEGDKVKAKYYVCRDDGDEHGEWAGYVEYVDAKYIVNTGTDYNPYMSNVCLTEKWEIIGNIHENAELLK